jgi:ABC-2 type transport system ATP-binding protein
MTAVRVQFLSRSFILRGWQRGCVVALSDVSFTLEAGTIGIILGHNGAGKTTLLEILATLLLPEGGSAQVLGRDVRTHAADVRHLVAYAPAGGSSFFPRLTGRENLEYFAALHDIPRRDWRRRACAAAAVFGLEPALGRRVDTYSDGMRQRLGLARAWMVDARVWLLDEPTRGLDPDARAVTQRALVEARSRGITVLASTHDLAEAAAIADRVIILHRGRAAFEASAGELSRSTDSLTEIYRRVTESHAA